jgi:hypothetical protein
MNGIGFGGAGAPTAQALDAASNRDNAMDVGFMRPFLGMVK